MKALKTGLFWALWVSNYMLLNIHRPENRLVFFIYDGKGLKLLKNRRNPAQGGCYKKSKLAPCFVENGGFLRVWWCCCVDVFFVVGEDFYLQKFFEKFSFFSLNYINIRYAKYGIFRIYVKMLKMVLLGYF